MFYSERAPLYLQLCQKIEFSQMESHLYPKNPYIDTLSFRVKDKIVSGNPWFSIGNYFVAPSGYHPVCMYYYDVKIRNKLVFHEGRAHENNRF